MSRRRTAPGLRHERAWWDRGADVVIGVDEVGRGAWAGPLTIVAAVIPRDRRVRGVRDSKELTPAVRERLYDRLAGWCDAWAVGHAWPEECDSLGMSAAQRLATQRALAGLDLHPDVVLVDGPWDFVTAPGSTGGPEVETIVKGDRHSLSIATASVLAKVTRDRIMVAEHEHHPEYDFRWNKGYPCPRHQCALQGYGASAIHRRSWVFMDHLVWTGQWRPGTAIPAPELTLF